MVEQSTQGSWGVVVDCLDPQRLAAFYQGLLGWQLSQDDEGRVLLVSPEGLAWLAFHEDPGFEPPVWPTKVGYQQRQLQLSFAVSDLARAMTSALSAGAQRCELQLRKESYTLLDPAGHLFCLSRAPEPAAIDLSDADTLTTT